MNERIQKLSGLLVFFMLAGGLVSILTPSEVSGMESPDEGKIIVAQIDSVHPGRGEITLDGHEYYLPSGRQVQSSASTDEKELNFPLERLRPGMWVNVLTDGTEPSEGHKPRVIRIWQGH